VKEPRIKMRVLVLGCGLMGSAIARDLVERGGMEVTIAARDEGKLREYVAQLGSERASAVGVDARDEKALVELMRGSDVVVGALPGRLGFGAMRAAIEAGTDMVDISFMPQNPLELDDLAKAAEVTIIPDCGVAPGLSNMLVGYGASRLDRVKEVHIKVGGLPQNPTPPLGYRITWSVEDLLEEYTRRARIVQDGEVKEVEALSGLEMVDLPGIGRLECFYTDGLRTLLHTIEADVMDEKTLRYPGHAEEIKTLVDCGLLSAEPVRVDDTTLEPKRFLAALLSPFLELGEEKDLTVMKIDVVGENNGEEVQHTFQLIDRYDEARGITSMARTTGYTASVVAQMVARGEIEGRGVVPPERLGMEQKLFKPIVRGLSERGIRVVEAIKVIHTL